MFKFNYKDRKNQCDTEINDVSGSGKPLYNINR